MKALSGGLQSHLDSGSTTMSYCWKLTRTDGAVQGYTDHDRDLAFGGLTYLASSGFTSSQLSQKLGLSVDNLDIEGGLNADTINEADLASGLYDNADVEIWWVNWQDTDELVQLSKGNLGEVTRGKSGFEAEFRSISHVLQQKTGRTYMGYCDTKIGGPRCGVNLNVPAYQGNATISIIQGRRFTVTGLSAYESGWFDSGLLTFTSGANDMAVYEVKRFVRSGAVDVVELWFPTTSIVTVTDTFSITAGCGKDSVTCRAKFGNIDNFRGFPHMPGNDAMTAYPIIGDGSDGKSLFK